MVAAQQERRDAPPEARDAARLLADSRTVAIVTGQQAGLFGGPVFTLLILRLSGVERLSRGQVAGVATAALGALVFTADKLLSAHWQASLGDLTLLVAAALFSYYTVASKPLIQHHGGATVLGYGILVAMGRRSTLGGWLDRKSVV